MAAPGDTMHSMLTSDDDHMEPCTAAEAFARGVQLFNRLNVLYHSDTEDAERWLRCAVELDPQDATAATQLATFYSRLYTHPVEASDRGRWREDAARWYRRALELDSSNTTAAAGLAMLLTHEDPGQDHVGTLLLEEVECWCRKLLEGDPCDNLAAFELGRVLEWRGADREAHQWYLRAAELDPSDRDAMAAIVALTERRSHSRAEAKGRYWSVAELGYGPAARKLAESLKAEGEVAQAHRWLRLAGEASDAEAAYWLGLQAEQRGAADEAEQWYRAAATGAVTWSSSAAYRLAMMCEARGDTEEALAAYSRTSRWTAVHSYRHGLLLERRGELASGFHERAVRVSVR